MYCFVIKLGHLMEKSLILGNLKHFLVILMFLMSLFCSYLCQKARMMLYPDQNNVL